MKRRFLGTVLFALVLLSAKAQFRNIPSEVTDSFHSKFPQASHIAWKDKITNFQAEFTDNDVKVKASFSSKGEWQKTERELPLSKLPAEVRDGLKKSKFADYPVKEVTMTEEPEKGTLYRLIVKKGDITKRSLYFTPQGQLVKDDINF